MDLKVGDIVKLKAGGPRMTVETLKPNEDDTYGEGKWVGTVWFVPQMTAAIEPGVLDWNGPFHGVFSVESLEAA